MIAGQARAVQLFSLAEEQAIRQPNVSIAHGIDRPLLDMSGTMAAPMRRGLIAAPDNRLKERIAQ